MIIGSVVLEVFLVFLPTLLSFRTLTRLYGSFMYFIFVSPFTIKLLFGPSHRTVSTYR